MRPVCTQRLCTPSHPLRQSSPLKSHRHIQRCTEGPIATSDDEIHSLTLEDQAAGDSVVRVVVQDRLVVLPAVEHANDGNQIAGHVEGDRGALAVVRDAQTEPT